MRHAIVLALTAATSLSLSAYVQGEPRWKSNIITVYQGSLNPYPDSMRRMRDRSFGSAEWKVGETPTLSVVDLTFTYGGRERDLSWAILFGHCRSASLPVLPISVFPELEVTGGGAIRTTARLQIALPTTGQYHIDIYSDRIGGEETVVACGDFRYSEKD